MVRAYWHKIYATTHVHSLYTQNSPLSRLDFVFGGVSFRAGEKRQPEIRLRSQASLSLDSKPIQVNYKFYTPLLFFVTLGLTNALKYHSYLTLQWYHYLKYVKYIFAQK